MVDAFNFIKWHYMFHGGRVLFLSILVFALRLGQSFIQCFQAIWIWLSCFMMYTLFKRKRYDIFVALVTVTCFGSLSMRGLIDSVFWYTASVIFFWPILPMTIGFLLWKKGLTNKKTTFGCALAFFIAAFSEEQWAVAIICAFVILFVWDVISKDVVKAKNVVYISGVTGALIELLAPGNFVRVDETSFYDMGFISKILFKTPLIFDVNFDLSNGVEILLLGFTVLVVISALMIGRKRKILIATNIIISLLLLLVGFVNINASVKLCVRIVYAVFIAFEIGGYFITKKKIFNFAFFIGAIATQGMMVMAPNEPSRIVMPFQLIFIILILDILTNESDIWKSKLYRFIFGVIIIAAIVNIGYITYGYYKNIEVNEFNKKAFEAASEQYAKGQKIEKINLKRKEDDRFSSVMPYQEGREYLIPFYESYYEIEDVEFVWK